jgi:GTP-binding protein
MIIRSAEFIKSSRKVEQCPGGSIPEFAFIGRSNVGKSSLINMLTGRIKLAKISGTPGKTRTINHFLINDEWYLVDLPGYGYARTPKKMREEWDRELSRYILQREPLICLFVLIDSRIEPQNSDIRFLDLLGINQVPLVRVFTKADKISGPALRKNLQSHDRIMSERWSEMPNTFITSAENRTGRNEILDFIEKSLNIFKNGS